VDQRVIDDGDGHAVDDALIAARAGGGHPGTGNEELATKVTRRPKEDTKELLFRERKSRLLRAPFVLFVFFAASFAGLRDHRAVPRRWLVQPGCRVHPTHPTYQTHPTHLTHQTYRR
jgi:hypothetical protein